MKKEFNALKKEHNKVADWIEYFNHKIIELEDEIKRLKREADETKRKEEILGRTVLHLIRENKKDITDKKKKTKMKKK